MQHRTQQRFSPYEDDRYVGGGRFEQGGRFRDGGRDDRPGSSDDDSPAGYEGHWGRGRDDGVRAARFSRGAHTLRSESALPHRRFDDSGSLGSRRQRDDEEEYGDRFGYAAMADPRAREQRYAWRAGERRDPYGFDEHGVVQRSSEFGRFGRLSPYEDERWDGTERRRARSPQASRDNWRADRSGSPPEGRRPQMTPSGSPPEGRRPQTTASGRYGQALRPSSAERLRIQPGREDTPRAAWRDYDDHSVDDLEGGRGRFDLRNGEPRRERLPRERSQERSWDDERDEYDAYDEQERSIRERWIDFRR